MITKIRKAQPDQGSVYVIPEMNSYSTGWMLSQDEFVSDKFFSSMPTSQQAGKYKVFPKGYFLRDQMKKRADGARSAGTGFVTAEQNYFCDVWALHTKQGRQTRANAKLVDLDQAATRLLSMMAMLSMEIEWTSTYFTTGVWTTEKTGVASSPSTNQFLSWMDATAKPLTDLKTFIRDQKKLTGFRPNKLCFSEKVWDVFTEHPNVIGRVDRGQTTGLATVTKEQVAAYLRVNEIHVAGAIKATTVEDITPSTDTTDFIVGDGVLLAYVNPTPSILEPTAGLTFHWTNYLEGATGAFGQVMQSWYTKEEKAYYYEIEQARDLHLVSADMGTFVATPLAV